MIYTLIPEDLLLVVAGGMHAGPESRNKNTVSYWIPAYARMTAKGFSKIIPGLEIFRAFRG